MKRMKQTILLFALLLATTLSLAQQTVTGTVVDENEDPLVGATVVEVGNTSNGAITDVNGQFTLTVPANAELRVSYVGHESNIFLSEEAGEEPLMLTSSTALDEVVVTALGITREKKSLTYSVQEVGNSTLVQSQENNVANALSGKVSGLQVVRGSNGPASSSKLVLRGMSSLRGDNQPLIVVDGIPMDNFTGASNNDFWNASPDMGNGLGDINPDNIESISVLKGGAAAALYGSRAGNGVILVTTKKGSATEGLGITYSVDFGLQSTFLTPDYQSSFGQGSEGIYNPLSALSWGPAIEGQQVEGWDGNMVSLSSHENLDNYLETGTNWTHNLSFQNRISDASSLYSSLSYMDDQSMLPGAALERINVLTRNTSSFGPDKNWTTDVKVQYIQNKADNRPFNGHPTSLKNTAASVYLLPRSLDITDFSAGSDEFGNMIWYEPSNSLNPYWGVQNDLNHDERDRFMLSGTVTNQLNDWLSAEVRGGADIYSTVTNSRTYSGGPRTANGQYTVGDNNFNETNFSGMLTAQKDNLFGKWGSSLMVGGNLMHTKFESMNINAGQLEVPDFFEVNNSIANPTVSKGYSERKINSVYGQATFNYDEYFFLDITGRNDWSSTLSEENRSYFYPSVSSSFVISDFIDSKGSMPYWMNFAKIRASYSEVGNSLGPYELYNFFTIGSTPNGVTSASRNSTLFNPDVESELIKSVEAGIEGRFFNDRFGFDFTYYKSNATNQLLNLPLNPLSGYSSFKANAGDIQNEGIELMLDAQILTGEEFAWTTSVNLARNRNLIVELTDDVSQINFITWDNMSIVAAEGEEYGQIWGSKYKRVEDPNSEYYGQRVVDADGLPVAAEGSYLLGSQQPDAIIGWTNRFRYKNIDAGFLIDSRFGGEMFSGTNRSLKANGMLDETVVGGAREDFVVEGVVEDGNRGYTKNSTAVSPQLYWQAVSTRSGNLGINEENVYDATNIRIRNAYVNYQLPPSVASSLKMQKLKIGATVNNLAMLKNNLNGIDPESVYATSTNALGFESLSSPTPRTVFFNIVAGF